MHFLARFVAERMEMAKRPSEGTPKESETKSVIITMQKHMLHPHKQTTTATTATTTAATTISVDGLVGWSDGCSPCQHLKPLKQIRTLK